MSNRRTFIEQEGLAHDHQYDCVFVVHELPLFLLQPVVGMEHLHRATGEYRTHLHEAEYQAQRQEGC